MPTLLDGRDVASDSPEWRAECDARHVAALPSLEARRAYLAGVAEKRGQAAADALRAVVAEAWRARP